MKQVYRIDDNGFYIEPVILKERETLPSNCVEVTPTNGLYKAKFVDGQWIDGLSQVEIDAIVNAPVPLTPLEELQKQQADLIFELMMNGVI